MKKFLIAAVLAGAVAALAGCSTQPTGAGRRQVDHGNARRRHHGGRHDQRHHHLGVTGTRRAPARNPLKDPNNILSKRSIYFEFDSFVVEDQYKPHDRGAREVPVGQPRPPRSRCRATPTSAARASTTSRWARSAPTRSSA